MSHPKNPVSGRNNRPRDLGQTRIENRNLQYKNPLTDKWEPAVHLQSIRAELLRRAHWSHYRHAKAHGNVYGNEPTNYTAFLPKDRDVGTARAHRPDILFQIQNDAPRCVKPNGYVMHNGRIILDAFDHGLRNFPELPVVLSSELEGSDIEYYYRQNAEIADYDLIARMPNGYMAGKYASRRHEGPPRVGTINQRAQRFRTRAACLAWCKREGTRAKNETILKIIPEKFKNPAVNSTKGFRELTKAEIAIVENKGITPSRQKRQKRKTRGNESDDDEGTGDWSGEDTSQTDDELTLVSIETPQESVKTGRARRHPTTSSRTLPGLTPSFDEPVPTIESPDISSRMTLRSRRVLAPPASFMDEDTRASVGTSTLTPVRRTTLHRETGTKSLPPVTETSSPLHEEAESSTAGRKRRHQTDDTAVSDEEFVRRPRPNANIETPNLTAYLNRVAPHLALELEDLKKEVLHGHNAWQNLQHRVLNPNEEFEAETERGILAGDYRYMAPEDHGWKEEDMCAISRALELTRIQFCDLKGHSVPGEFTDYMHESYASQWRRIQTHFEQIWTPFSKPTTLYRLPQWRGGFAKWKVPKNDKVGKTLLDRLRTGERALTKMEKDFQKEDRLEAEEAARKTAVKEEEEEEEDEEEEE